MYFARLCWRSDAKTPISSIDPGCQYGVRGDTAADMVDSRVAERSEGSADGGAK